MRLRQLIERYRLPTFLIGAMSLAGIMVVVSVSIYYMSGAYQLDLSRPEYQSVRSEIENEKKDAKAFETQGSVDAQVLEGFLDEYKQESRRLIEADAFSGDVLSDEQLGLE